jgi:hypothetical protein
VPGLHSSHVDAEDAPTLALNLPTVQFVHAAADDEPLFSL